MQLHERVNHYYQETDLNCAEAMLQGCKDHYQLQLPEEARFMLGIMGRGMQTEDSCCGAYTVAVAVIGLLTGTKGVLARHNAQGIALIKALHTHVMQQYPSLQCAQLKATPCASGCNPCHKLVEYIAQGVEQILAEEGIRPTPNPA